MLTNQTDTIVPRTIVRRSAGEFFERGLSDRSAVHRRQVQAAELTVPSLYPDINQSESSELYTPYQSLGAEGFRSLSSKFMFALFPPNEPFFSFMPDQDIMRELDEAERAGEGAIKEKAIAYLRDQEQIVVKFFEGLKVRPALTEAIKQYFLGNVCLELEFAKDKPAKNRKSIIVHRLNTYVVERSPDGVLLALCFKNKVSYEQLTEEERALSEVTPEDKDIFVYTLYELHDERWAVLQEIGGKVVHAEDNAYSAETFPFIVLRGSELSDENYGRGLLTEIIGDLRDLEDNTQSLSDAGKICSKMIPMVRPGSIIDIDQVSQANTGDWVYGNEGDINFVKVDKTPDLSFVLERVHDKEASLRTSFLMLSSIQRDAERVTATEITRVANELDETLGGQYTLLAQQLQEELIRHVLRKCNSAILKVEGINVVVTTGLEALGRTKDFQRLSLYKPFVDSDSEGTINKSEYNKRVAHSLNLNPAGLILPVSRFDQQQQQQQMAMEAQQQQEGISQQQV